MIAMTFHFLTLSSFFLFFLSSFFLLLLSFFLLSFYLVLTNLSHFLSSEQWCLQSEDLMTDPNNNKCKLLCNQINVAFPASFTKNTSSWCSLKVYCWALKQSLFSHKHTECTYVHILMQTHAHVQRGAEYVGGLTATWEVLTTTKNVCQGGEKGDGCSTNPLCTSPSVLPTAFNWK